MSQPFVIVIVPVWNSPVLLAKRLDALAAQTYPANRFEIPVVDNGSTDATPQVARGYSSVSLLQEPAHRDAGVLAGRIELFRADPGSAGWWSWPWARN